MIIRSAAFARAGLVGNPSDGYFGKTISIIVRNFSARITLYKSRRLEILPSQQDHSRFGSIAELVRDVELNGYYGGVRLIKATVKKFADYCAGNGIVLPESNFTVEYATDIPRQLGLAGSSAIITATLRALLQFYGVQDMPKEYQPTFILSVETEELGLSAGLQDRVVQVYEGIVYMDFSRELMEREHRGLYEPLDPKLLPPLFIAYRTDLSEVSKVFHDNIRHRFEQGDPGVIEAMHNFARCAELAREALLAGHPEQLGPLLSRNFDQRAAIYPLDPRNHRMVQIARDQGTHAKFAGSGGAIVEVFTDPEQYRRLRDAYHAEGFEIIQPEIVPDR